MKHPKDSNFVNHYIFEYIVFFLVAILLMVFWNMMIDKELSAPPIVIDKTKTRQELSNEIITNDNEEPGKSGYALQGLGQGCEPTEQKFKVPNLPGFDYETPCDSSQGLVCIQGLVEGGGICLKDINQKCKIKNDCVPLADFCLYGFCQQQGEVINKPCVNDTDCQGSTTNNLNHICDPISKRCKFDLFPQDSGCAIDSQCVFYSDNPNLNESFCIQGDSLIKIDTKFQEYNDSGGNKIVSLRSDQPNTILKKGFYVQVLTNNDLKIGRYLLKDILSSGSGTSYIFDVNTFNEVDDVKDYIIEIGGKDDGICLVSMPAGVEVFPVTNDKNININFPCDTGLKVSDSINGKRFCIEEDRENIKGAQGEICNTLGLDCQDGLSCTYSLDLQNRISSNKNSFNKTYEDITVRVIGNDTSFQAVDTIGRCQNQIIKYQKPCSVVNSGCEKPNICIGAVNELQKNFSFCARNWDVLEGTSLIGCPKNFILEPVPGTANNINLCKSEDGKTCIEDDNCLIGKKCGDNSTIRSFNFDGQEFDTYINNSKFSRKQPIDRNGKIYDRLISTREQQSNGISPRAIGVYNFNINANNDNKPEINMEIFDNNVNNSNIQRTIIFDNKSIDDVDVKIHETKEGDLQLNVIYLEEYKNYNRREYGLILAQGNLLINSNFGLCESADIYIEKSDTASSSLPIPPYEIYRIEYSKITDKTTTNDKIISDALIRVTGSGSCFFPGSFTPQNYRLVSYDCNYKFNINSNGTNPLYFFTNNPSSDGFNYYSNLDTSFPIRYYQNADADIQFETVSGLKSLVDGNKYYYVKPGGNSLRNALMLTEEKNYYNNPIIGDHTVNSILLKGGPNNQFSSNSQYLTLDSLHGINIFSEPLTNGSKTITISNKIDHYEIPNPTRASSVGFNKPVGFLTQKNSLSDYSVDIDKDFIFISSNLENTKNQCVKLSYGVSKFTDENKYSSRIVYSVENGESGVSTYLNYDIVNTFTPPNPKIYSDTNYIDSDDNTIFPYTIDSVKNYVYPTENYSSVDFFANYKDIKSQNYVRYNIANEVKFKKLNYNYSGKNPPILEYQDTVQNPNPPTEPNNFFVPPKETFGYCTPIILSPFKLVGNEIGNTDNFFLLNDFKLELRNTEDIDKVLKYSSSELVIGFQTKETTNGFCDYFICITGILSYDITSDLIETLSLKSNIFITNSKIVGKTPYLFANNIVPFNFVPDSSEGTPIFSGSIIVTSCISEESQLFQKVSSLTSYNKLLFKTNNNTGPFGFMDIRSYKGRSDGNFLSTVAIFEDEIINNNSDIENFKLYTTSEQEINGTLAFLTNNLFNSSLSFQKAIIFNNITRTINNQSKMINFIFSDDIRKGNTNLSIDSVPFYNGFKTNQGALDQSYKTLFNWPYWLTSLNTSTNFKFYKMILTYNPGNAEEMFYYCFAKVNDNVLLLKLSSVLTNTTIIESLPIPLKLKNNATMSDIEAYSKRIIMTPYDKKIYTFFGSCQ